MYERKNLMTDPADVKEHFSGQQLIWCVENHCSFPRHMLLVLWLLLLGTLAFINSANCWHPKLKLSLLSYGLWDCSLWPVVKQIPSAKVFVFSYITPTQGMGMRLYLCPETLPMLQACRSTQSKEFHQELIAADFASLLQRINSWNVPCLQLHPPACTGKEA